METAISNDPNRYLLSEDLWYGSGNNNGNLYNATEGYGAAVPKASLSQFSMAYGYDNVNRLSSAAFSSAAGYRRTYGYDAYGNMWVTGAYDGPWSGATPTANVYTNNRINGASYDQAGNQLAVNGDAIAYDAENRQSAAPDGTTEVTENYLYDGAGQRVKKTVAGGASTVYAYDAFGQLAAEYASVTAATPCTTCYLVWDQLGTTRLVTDQNGNVVGRHDYLAFGEEIPAGTAGRNGQWGAGNDNVAQKFTGQMRDQETGLDFFHARYYGAALGRFTSPDPANAGTAS